MKRTTKSLVTVLAASALVLGVGADAYARGGFGPGCYGGGPGANQGMWGGRGGPTGGPGAGMRGPGRGMAGPGAWTGGFRGPMAAADPATTAQQLDRMKADLGITRAQERAWQDYATAVTTRAAVMNGHRQAWLSGTMTPEQMQELRQTGMTQRQRMMTARQELYGALTPDQRATAAPLLMGPGGRGGRW